MRKLLSVLLLVIISVTASAQYANSDHVVGLKGSRVYVDGERISNDQVVACFKDVQGQDLSSQMAEEPQWLQDRRWPYRSRRFPCCRRFAYSVLRTDSRSRYCNLSSGARNAGSGNRRLRCCRRFCRSGVLNCGKAYNHRRNMRACRYRNDGRRHSDYMYI